jgi:hypothetical protein
VTVRLALVLGVFAIVALTGDALGASSAGPKPSWRCVAGVCVGTSREAVEYRFAGYADRFGDKLSFSVRVPGGHLQLLFVKEVDAVSLDNATPVNHVTKVETCDPLFRLPDGVVKGTPIPFGKTWRGYRFGYGGEPYGPIWQKRVREGSKTLRVRLHILKGRVNCVGLSRPTG